ncbi:hypothetical protein MTR67_043770 [Solanum verrucosum]|uniref:Uncharacterized protein n=1 Tax=Solanum verrucosum TaxID=315347 RepID=A0AAF0UQX0_SOLVR|nr:hypothetical protein MTR67_043770 [Solanum verrucosum]
MVPHSLLNFQNLSKKGLVLVLSLVRPSILKSMGITTVWVCLHLKLYMVGGVDLLLVGLKWVKFH